MTRINLVPVESLADQHLLAEWREIKMIPAAVRRYLKTRSLIEIKSRVGPRYTLGKGHVSFFYDKLDFLSKRYELLTEELQNRGVNIQYTGDFSIFVKDLPAQLYKDSWEPDEDEIEISKTRIKQKIAMKPEWYRYCGEKKDMAFFTALLDIPF